jgi:hypothetical protein
MTPPKVLLTIVTGGIVVGALMGQLANPRMKVAASSRVGHSDSQFSSSPLQVVETGPEDLAPAAWSGPVYARPAVFAPQNAPVPEYAPATSSEEYSAGDPEPFIAPEVDQTSADAAETAATLAGPSPSNRPRSDASRPAGGSDIAPTGMAPADQTS